ncbi:Uncharacterised protein [Candidatus Anstonella stagnisolia]|nr:Uncharacterised protein [Candidatus Anstonella stagnisolia]
MQRKKFAALLFLLLLIPLLAYFLLPQKQAQQQEKIFFAAVRPRSFQLISYGGQSAFFAAFAFENSGVSSANVTLSCSQEQPTNGFCVLEHPYATGFDAAGFRRGFEEGLRSFGLEAKKVPTSGIQNCVGATILAPTGVLPLETEGLISGAQQSGSKLLFAGEVSDFTIDSLGQVRRLPQNKSMQEILQQMEVSPSSLNSNLYPAGYSLALSKIYASAPSSFHASIQFTPSSSSQNLTLIAYAPQNISSGYCRLIYEAVSVGNNRSAGISQGSRLIKPPSLSGSQKIFAGEVPYYSVWVEPAAGSRLALYATAGDFAGTIVRQKIFEGSIRSGWLGGLELANVSRAGYYVVSIEDQFSRTYAKSLLRVQDLQVKISSIDGAAYHFSATLDGEPIDSQLATVSIEGSNSSMQYPVTFGTFTVAARPSSQESAFIVELSGVKKRVAFSQQRNPFLYYLLQFAAPLLLAALLIFMIVRRKPKRKYGLRIPDFSQQPEPEIELPSQDFLRAFEIANAHFGYIRLPLDCSELAVGLRRLCTSKGALSQLSRQGIEDALLQMQKSGRIVGHCGFYAPSSWNLQIEEAANMRILSNVLVQKGCIFPTPLQNSNQIFASCPFERVHIRVCPQNFSSLNPKHAAGAKNILAFDSDARLRSFHLWLKSGAPNAARLSLLIKNKKLFLCISSGLEEFL